MASDYDTKRAKLHIFAIELGRQNAVPGDWALLADMSRDLIEIAPGLMVRAYWQDVARQADKRSVPPT